MSSRSQDVLQRDGKHSAKVTRHSAERWIALCQGHATFCREMSSTVPKRSHKRSAARRLALCQRGHMTFLEQANGCPNILILSALRRRIEWSFLLKISLCGFILRHKITAQSFRLLWDIGVAQSKCVWIPVWHKVNASGYRCSTNKVSFAVYKPELTN